MKKLVVMALAVCCALLLVACGADAVDEMNETGGDTLQLVNPIHECTAEELTAQTGLSLNIPETATDVDYCYIDGDTPLAQARFTCEGNTYLYRGQQTATIQDISGMEYPWMQTTNDAEDTPYTCYFTDAGQGIAIWYTSGASYALAMTENASEDALVTMYGIVTGGE